MTPRPNSIRSFPAFSADLLDALEAAFPNRLPLDPDVSPTTIACQVGQQQVIALLRSRLEAHIRSQR